MDTGQAFVGFQEAPINFPPTFKYDVKRSFRHRTKSIMDRKKRLEEKVHRLTEVEEQELEELKKEEAEELDEGELEAGEDASMASSTWTSVRSKGTPRELDEDEFDSSPSSQTIPTASSNVSITRKAKAKWLSLVANSPASPKIQKVRDASFLPWKPRLPDGSVDVFSEGKAASQVVVSSDDTVDQARLRPQISIVSSSFKSDQPEGKEEDEGKGVYDSSHKKRVPSWYSLLSSSTIERPDAAPRCDRIIWKTTVEPEEEDVPLQLRPRNRMGQFFANAFRPLSARVRKDSAMSDSHEDGGQVNILEDAPVLSRPIQPVSIPNRRRSVDIVLEQIGGPKEKNVDYGDISIRRSTSASSLSSPQNGLPNRVQMRRVTASSAIPGTIPSSTTPHLPTPSGTGRWRFFPSFLSLTTTQSSPSTDLPSGILVPSMPRKGDVVCLAYDTLDDRGMGRLEGRSDHRPVIGIYIIYL